MARSGAPAAGRGGDLDEAWASLVRLAGAVPRGLSPDQQVVVRQTLNDAWSRVLALVVAAREDGEGAARVDRRVAGALAAIEQSYADSRLKLREVARRLAVSPSHLTQVLKAATGHTFGAHLHARRVAAARLLLADSELSVKEVACCVGYATTTQLDRHFRKSVRRSPSAYRAAVRVTSPRASTHSTTHPQK